MFEKYRFFEVSSCSSTETVTSAKPCILYFSNLTSLKQKSLDSEVLRYSLKTESSFSVFMRTYIETLFFLNLTVSREVISSGRCLLKARELNEFSA